jgi:hypothetical protein
LRTERVNNVLHFDICQGDADMGGDMDDDAGAGIQAGVQTDRPSTRVGMAQATTSMNEVDTQTPPCLKKRQIPNHHQ